MPHWARAIGIVLGLAWAMPAAAQGPSYNWTGCYVGGNIGWAGSDADVITSPALRWLVITSPAQQASVTHAYDFDDSSATGGGQVGCNWQPQGSGLVLGVEGDFDWADLDNYAHIAYAPAAPYLGRTDTLSYSVDWFGTVRGRLGYAWDSLLLYATGGLAYGRVASTYHSVFSDQTMYDGAVAKRRSGWALGAGGEWAFAGNWSARAEYLHIDLGSFDYNAGQVGNPLFAWHNDVETKVDVVRFGVNYRLGDLFLP